MSIRFLVGEAAQVPGTRPHANDDHKPPSPSDFCWFDFWGTVSDERQARAEERARIREEM